MSFHVCWALILSEELCDIRIFWWIKAFAFTLPLQTSVLGEQYHQCIHIFAVRLAEISKQLLDMGTVKQKGVRIYGTLNSSCHAEIQH